MRPGHLRREIHRGQRLARARRTVEQQAPPQVPPARAQPLGVIGDAEHLPLDALEHAGREHDPVARDLRQRAHGQRRVLVVVEVPRAQLEHPAAVDVALAHQDRQVGEDALPALALGRHDLQPEALAHPVIAALEHHHRRAFVVAREPHAGLHAGDALVLAERNGHVLDGAELEPRTPLRRADQLGQPGPVALDHRQAHHLDLAAGGPRVDRHLEVRPVRALERAGDDRQLGGIAAEVVAQALPHRRLGLWCVALGPRREPLERVGQLLGFHDPDPLTDSRWHTGPSSVTPNADTPRPGSTVVVSPRPPASPESRRHMKRLIPLAFLGVLALPAAAQAAPVKISPRAADVTQAGGAIVEVANTSRHALRGTASVTHGARSHRRQAQGPSRQAGGDQRQAPLRPPGHGRPARRRGTRDDQAAGPPRRRRPQDHRSADAHAAPRRRRAEAARSRVRPGRSADAAVREPLGRPDGHRRPLRRSRAHRHRRADADHEGARRPGLVLRDGRLVPQRDLVRAVLRPGSVDDRD